LVVERESHNKNISTGEIEVIVNTLTILNTAKQPPIIINDKTDALEDTRLKYRYLDLRRPVMQNFLVMKSKITNAFREFLVENDFLELETPILAKSTPEGARDFLVPSRLHKGKFYALPQSPQIFKQLYMISGFEKYFQIAKSFRDEDLRADRQLEFNQIDIETSFLNELEIQDIIERMFKFVFKKILNIDFKNNFKRMTYSDCINLYGSDKPDIRFDMKLIESKDLYKDVPFINDKEACKAIVVNNANYTRKQIDEYTRVMKVNNANGLAYIKLEKGELTGSINKFLTDESKKQIINFYGLKDNDMVFIIADKLAIVNKALGALRKLIGNELQLFDKDSYEFLWVTDFPIFEYNDETKKYDFSANPFASPKEECIKYLETDKDKCFANAYDLVLNGYELGSGSLRIYNEDLQSKMFDIIGISKEEAINRFGFFIESLKYGTPPHGGIGLGLERIVMLMTKTDNIRDVIAFPKTLNGTDLMMECPGDVDDTQLNDLNIQIKN
ncbi:MAG: aspartate--tRNA ligase, partial [Anaeroplasmataceae bacterium]